MCARRSSELTDRSETIRLSGTGDQQRRDERRYPWAMFRTSACLLLMLAANTEQAVPERGAALLTISFAAVGADGQSPADLKAGEVTIKIDGRERPIRSLQSIAAADAPGASPDAPPLPP